MNRTPYDTEQQALEDSDSLTSNERYLLSSLRYMRTGYLAAVADYQPLVAACRALVAASISRGFCNYCQMSFVTGQYTQPDEGFSTLPFLAHTDTCIVWQAQNTLVAAGEGAEDAEQETRSPGPGDLDDIAHYDAQVERGQAEPQAMSDPLLLLDGTIQEQA